MGPLSEILNSIVGQLLRTETMRESPSPAPAFRPDEIGLSEQIQAMLEGNLGGEPKIISPRRTQTPLDASISQLKSYLQCSLKDYIDPQTENIGYAFPEWGPRRGSNRTERSTFQPNGLNSIECVSSLDSFARALAKGAVLIGVERVTGLLLGWLEGLPVEFRTSAIINGLNVNEPFTLANGVYIAPLPLSTDKLPPHLPRRRDVSEKDYLGRTVVSLDCSASPALFFPREDLKEAQTKALFTSDFDFNALCLALALEFDSFVEPGFYWNDYQVYNAFFFVDRSESWSAGNEHFRQRSDTDWSLNTNNSTGVTTLRLGEQPKPHISETQLYSTLRAVAEIESEPTQVAVSRWMKSKDTNKPLVDRFIDLRIALESLYLQDFPNEYTHEMRFRLALFGAWHLGIDFKNRSEIRKKLRDVYDMASKAVHSGNVDINDKNQELLSDVQDLSRRGILKLLQEGFPEDWGALILGVEDDISSA